MIRYRAPDNGGASGAAYLHSAFGARLPDPFRLAVGTDLTPSAGSLSLVPDVLAPFVVVHRIVLSCPESLAGELASVKSRSVQDEALAVRTHGARTGHSDTPERAS
ncbi:MAG: hypothetical protein ACK42I_08655 [Thermomicrobium sp.]